MAVFIKIVILYSKHIIIYYFYYYRNLKKIVKDLIRVVICYYNNININLFFLFSSVSSAYSAYMHAIRPWFKNNSGWRINAQCQSRKLYCIRMYKAEWSLASIFNEQQVIKYLILSSENSQYLRTK